MDSTLASLPHVGQVPGKQNHWVLSGLDGGGMALFCMARGIADAILSDQEFEQTDIPSFYRSTRETFGKEASALIRVSCNLNIDSGMALLICSSAAGV